MGSESVGGIHAGGDATGALLIPATEEFFLEIVHRDFIGLECALAQDCRLQEGTVAGGRSVTGVDKVLEKLKDISERINRAGFKKAENVALMRNHAQTRFVLKTKIGFMSVSVGWRLDWSYGLITRIIIEKDPPSEEEFMLDDTEAPCAVAPPQSSAAAPPADSAAAPDAASEASSCDSIAVVGAGSEVPSKADEVDEDMTRPSLDGPPQPENRNASTDSSSGRERWRPGKFVKELAVTNKQHAKKGDPDKSLSPSSSCGFLDIAAMMNVELRPPYFVPQPPALAPMLKIAVLNCQNLSSRRVRFLERPVNAYVVVTVANCSHKTPICHRTSNPDFSSLEGETSFIFETPNTVEFRQHGFVEVEVRDSYPIGDAYDLLASLRIPMIALKSVVDSNTPAVVHLKLHQLEKFHKFGRRSHKSSLSEEDATIELAMAKIDIMQWWVVEETRAREEAAEARRREDRASKKAAASARSSQVPSHPQRLHHHLSSGPPSDGVGSGSRAVRDMSYDHTYERRSDGRGFIAVPKIAWMDGENCVRCGKEFTMFNRKHHCRFCGQVVCDKCSPYELVVSSGKKKRACDLCFSDGTKEILARNSEASQRNSESSRSSFSGVHSSITASAGPSTPEAPAAPLSKLAVPSTPSDEAFFDAMGSPVNFTSRAIEPPPLDPTGVESLSGAGAATSQLPAAWSEAEVEGPLCSRFESQSVDAEEDSACSIM